MKHGNSVLQKILLADKDSKLKVSDPSSHAQRFITAYWFIHYAKFTIIFGIFQTIH
jgi:hypothetical protein